jgi:hypothetical protein
MKITEKISGQSFAVYGIYWCDGKTFFYCFPANSDGLSSFSEDEVWITDRTIESEFEYVRTDERISGFFHKHLLGDGLMDDLLEHDPAAYKKFASLIGKVP